MLKVRIVKIILLLLANFKLCVLMTKAMLHVLTHSFLRYVMVQINLFSLVRDR